MAKKHFAISITGKVQGVYFRATAADEARKLGLTGFVRNESDGSVYIEAEGEEEALQKLVDWSKHGPPRAQVEEVQVKEGVLKHFISFDIRR